MAALMFVLMLGIVNMLMRMHFAIMLMSVLMLIVCMATHLKSPPFPYS
jgi:hypothetical protein